MSSWALSPLPHPKYPQLCPSKPVPSLSCSPGPIWLDIPSNSIFSKVIKKPPNKLWAGGEQGPCFTFYLVHYSPWYIKGSPTRLRGCTSVAGIPRKEWAEGDFRRKKRLLGVPTLSSPHILRSKVWSQSAPAPPRWVRKISGGCTGERRSGKLQGQPRSPEVRSRGPHTQR